MLYWFGTFIFHKNIKIIIPFLKKIFHSTPTLDTLCTGLLLFEKITHFFLLTSIDNKEDYKENY